jgi:hypothetical protein
MRVLCYRVGPTTRWAIEVGRKLHERERPGELERGEWLSSDPFRHRSAAFERGGPPANAPVDEAVAFFTTYRRELLIQSLMFVFSAGAYLRFFGSLRSFLQRAEGGASALSTVAFGAGIVSAGMQMVFQGFQVALASAGRVEPMLAGLFRSVLWALSVIAYVPLAVMFAAVAVVSLRTRASGVARLVLWIRRDCSPAHVNRSCRGERASSSRCRADIRVVCGIAGMAGGCTKVMVARFRRASLAAS